MALIYNYRRSVWEQDKFFFLLDFKNTFGNSQQQKLILTSKHIWKFGKKTNLFFP